MTKSLGVRSSQPIREGFQSDQRLQVVVVFTTKWATLIALKSAATLADGLSAEVRMVVPCIVPYPLPLDEPAVDTTVLSRSLRSLAQQAEVDCSIHIRLCRDRWSAFHEAIPPGSLVLVGLNTHWWDFRERKLANRLRQEGHHIAYAA